MGERPLTGEDAEAVWAILVEVCGATSDHGFVYHQTSEYVPEWRFMGDLGFGGKFRRGRGWRTDRTPMTGIGAMKVWGERWYVDCYPEDSTDERQRIIAEANRRLDMLKPERYDR